MCGGMTEQFHFLFTGHESWWKPDSGELKRKMREAYALSSGKRKEMTKRALSTVYNYSYDNFINKVKDIL